jgi:hypothetical protein
MHSNSCEEMDLGLHELGHPLILMFNNWTYMPMRYAFVLMVIRMTIIGWLGVLIGGLS